MLSIKGILAIGIMGLGILVVNGMSLTPHQLPLSLLS